MATKFGMPLSSDAHCFFRCCKILSAEEGKGILTETNAKKISPPLRSEFDEANPADGARFKTMEPFTSDETLQSICIVPGAAIAVAKFAAFKTFFVDAAHMKDAEGETKYESAQFVVVEAKTSLMEYLGETKNRSAHYVTKNLPLAISICLAESKDEYAFAYWTLARAGFDLNQKEYSIVHDRGKAVIAARATALPKADSFHCNQHVMRNVQALPGVGDIRAFRPSFLAMTEALTQKAFESARSKVCELLPPNAVKYVMDLEPALISAYHFRLKTGKSISFTNSNPVEAENWRLLPARWATHPLEAFIDIVKIWGSTFANHQTLIHNNVGEYSGVEVVPTILPVVKERAMGKYKMAEAGKLQCQLMDGGSSRVVQVTTVASLGDIVNVSLDERSCDCGKFAERQYPCVHALAAAQFLKFCPDQYVDLFAPMYLTSNIHQAHLKSIVTPSRNNLIASPSEKVLPSAHFLRDAKKAGRPPKNKRARSVGE
jgi:hypothetical protein